MTSEASNPMIADALAKGEDATGLCTVRELSAYLVEHRADRTTLHFIYERQRFTVEVTVTHVAPA